MRICLDCLGVITLLSHIVDRLPMATKLSISLDLGEPHI